MATPRIKKKKAPLTDEGIRRHAPADAKIPARLGGGVLKELVEQEMPSGKLRHYSLAYINPLIFSGDNGRVLGYDNSHGYPHRHFMGTITPEPNLAWEQIREKFEIEWREIALKFVNGEWKWPAVRKQRYQWMTFKCLMRALRKGGRSRALSTSKRRSLIL